MGNKVITALQAADWDIEKDQPEPEEMIYYYQHSLIDSGFAIVSLDVLNEFFNSKSDANKYLDASEQDDLETEFRDFLIGYTPSEREVSNG